MRLHRLRNLAKPADQPSSALPEADVPAVPVPWPTRRALRVGGVSLAVSLLLAMLNLPDQLTLGWAALVLAYGGMFAAGMIWIYRLEDGVWTGYPHLVSLFVLFTFELATALVTIVVGALLALAVQMRQRAARSNVHFTRALSVSLARVAITGGAVVAASAVWWPSELPLGAETLPRLVAALLSGFAGATLMDAIVRQGLTAVPARLAWLVRVRRVPLEIITQLLLLIYVLLAPVVPVPLQVLAILLLVLQAIRYKHVANMQNELRQRVVQLSQVNQAAEALASSLALNVLVEILCQQTQALTQANLIWLSLQNDEEDTRSEYTYEPHTGLVQIAGDTNEIAQRAAVLLASPDVRMFALPLRVGPQSLGELRLYTAVTVNHATRDALNMLVRQASLALKNAQLYAHSQALVGKLSLINSSMQDVMTHPDHREAIEASVEMAIQVGLADAVLLLRSGQLPGQIELKYDAGVSPEARSEFVSVFGFSPPRLPETAVTLSGDKHTGDPTLWSLLAIGGFQQLHILPLVSGRSTHGWLLLGNTAIRRLRTSDQELLQVLTQHIAANIDNAELFESLEAYAFEMAQLAHLSRTSASTLELDRIVADVGEILNQMMNVGRTTIALCDPDSGALYVAGTVRGMTYAPAAATDRVLTAFPEMDAWLKAQEHEYHIFHADATISTALRQLLVSQDEWSLAVLPMQLNEQLVGVLMLGCREKRILTEREWQLAEMAANQVSAQIANARLYTSTEQALAQRLEQLSLIEDLAGQISSTLDFNQIVRKMLEAALRSTQAHYAALILLNESEGARMVVIDYANGKFGRNFVNINLHASVVGQVLHSGSPHLTPDTRRTAHYTAPRTGTTYLSSLAVPLVRDGNVLGVLDVESETVNAFTEAHISFLKNLAGHAVISIGNAHMLEERQYQVKTLANLQALALRLSSAVDTPTVSRAILETACTLLDSDDAVIYRYHSTTDTCVPLAMLHASATDGRSELAVESACQAARTMTLVTLPANNSAEATIVSMPLQGGSARDVLTVTFHARRQLQRRHLDTLALLASQAAGHLENARLHEEIRAGHERMTTILNSTRDGVILLDRNGALVEANPASRRLLGEDFGSYLGEVRTRHFQPGASPPDAVFAEAIAAEDEDNAGLTRRQFERRDIEGMPCYLDEVGAPVLDEKGAVTGWLLVLRDVTEARLLEDYRDEITSMVVHDLRGPLASIISGLYIAMDELSQREGVELINMTVEVAADSANRLMDLVESLLDVSRMEARQMELQLDVVQVPRLVERAASALIATMQQADVVLERKLPSSLPELRCDYELLSRVLINLLDNAARYSPPGGVVQVSAEVLKDGTALLLRVADSGRGIPPDERERVFEKFKQAKGTANRNGKRGTGLGLTFCRLAVEAHGGQIWIEEHGPLPGASFAFTIPLHGVAPEPDMAGAQTAKK